MNPNGKFFFKPAQGEHIEAVLHIDKEARSSIYGVVLNQRGTPIDGALVLLFKTGSTSGEIKPISQAYTDEDGHFAFGGLEGDVLYLIKIFKYDAKIRELEILTE